MSLFVAAAALATPFGPFDLAKATEPAPLSPSCKFPELIDIPIDVGVVVQTSADTLLYTATSVRVDFTSPGEITINEQVFVANTASADLPEQIYSNYLEGSEAFQQLLSRGTPVRVAFETLVDSMAAVRERARVQFRRVLLAGGEVEMAEEAARQLAESDPLVGSADVIRTHDASTDAKGGETFGMLTLTYRGTQTSELIVFDLSPPRSATDITESRRRRACNIVAALRAAANSPVRPLVVRVSNPGGLSVFTGSRAAAILGR